MPSTMDAFIPGSAPILEYIDNRIMVAVRGNTYLYGTLRSYDQYGNIVLQDTVERVYYRQSYAEAARGLFLVRGQVISSMGRVDPQREHDTHARLQCRAFADVEADADAERQALSDYAQNKPCAV